MSEIPYCFSDILAIPDTYGRDANHRRALEMDVTRVCEFVGEMYLLCHVREGWVSPPPGEPWVGPHMRTPGLPYTPALSSL